MGKIKAGLVSGVWVLVLFVAVFGVVLNVPVVKGDSGTIYIRAERARFGMSRYDY